MTMKNEAPPTEAEGLTTSTYRAFVILYSKHCSTLMESEHNNLFTEEKILRLSTDKDGGMARQLLCVIQSNK